MITKRYCLLFILLFFASWCARGANSTEDAFYKGSIEHYPEPVPVASVKRNAVIKPNPLSLAYRGFSGATEGTRNQGVHVRITAVAPATVAGGKPGILQGLAITTTWKNVHARQKLDKKSLQKKADRTMGAGGFFGGSAKGGSKANQQVEKDIAYKVPSWGHHMFLLADGIAYSIDTSSAQLKNGANPSKGFYLHRYGQEREVQFLFRIPVAAKNIALQFFDNANGNIQIPIAGEVKLARGSGFPAGLIDQTKTAGLELGTIRIHSSRAAQGSSLPEGWKYLTVDLIGKSNLVKGGQPGFADIDASKYVWLEGDGGFAFEPSMVLNSNKKRLRFTPEYFAAQSISFIVPDKGSNFRLALRSGSELSYLKLSAKPPAAAPKPFKTFADGKVAAWHLYSVSRTENGLIVDIGVQGLDLEKGLEIKPYRQLRLDTDKKKLKPDKHRSQAFAFGAKTTVVVPPGGISRFVLVFNDTDGTATLHIKGLHSEGVLPVDKAPGGKSPLITMAMPAVVTTTAAGQSLQTDSKAGRQIGKQQVSSGQDQLASPASLKKFTLPDWDLTQAVQEKATGDSIEYSTDLGKGLVASGNVGGKSNRRDYFHFDVEGKPQLWAIEAAGPSVTYLAYLGASQKELIKRQSNRKSGNASILNLMLMPGRHRIKVAGSSKTGKYLVRAYVIAELQSGNEFEPNDGESHANRMVTGASMNGLLESGDHDMFRFSLAASEHLQIVLETSANMKGIFTVSGAVKPHAVSAKRTGESISYEDAFFPGDYMIRVRTGGSVSKPVSYRLSILRKNPFTAAGEEPMILPVEMKGPEKVQTVAAYWPQAQRINKMIRITNQQQSQLAMKLQVWTSNASWQAQLGMQAVTLAAGESKDIPLNILVEADAAGIEPVAVAIAAEDARGRMHYHSFEMEASCGAQAVKPVPYFSPPASLLGGLNVAWQGLGAKLPVNTSKPHKSVDALFDGMTPVIGGLNMPGFNQGKPVDFTIKLAGASPVPVAGFSLNPLGGCVSKNWARDFEVEISSDGKNFNKVLENTLERLPREQFFELEKPLLATHARLRVLNNYQQKPGRLCLGEWKVIARPDASLHSSSLNIARPELGGHVVWRSFRANDNVMNQLLGGSARMNTAYMISDLPNEWVVGFQHNRMVQISRLEWERDKGSTQASLKKVRLAVSRDGPAGPWQPLGEWEITGKDPVSSFPLDAPIWARFIRFSAEVKKSQYVELPRQIRIFEQQTRPDYRSVVGEWGHYASSGPYEWQKSDSASAPASAKATKPANNHSQAKATALQFDKTYQGTASLGAQTAWYRLTVPQGGNTLEWQLSGYPSLSVRPVLMTEQGRQIPFRSQKISGKTSRYVADVKAGSVYLMKVEEPPRSVVFAWDNSGSVQSYSPRIYQAMSSFADQIIPGREYVNLLPFQDKAPAMLLQQWSDQPLTVLKDLNEYNRKDASSNAELNLKKAVEELEDQDGSRAILIITDAESGKTVGLPDLWEPINKVYPRIFSFEMQSGRPASQDKMQDWASVNSGYYTFFRNQSDLDVGFDRAVCMLRRVAEFELVARSKFRKPAGPGKIKVTTSRGSSDTAVEIILDASGSMYKKLGGTTRIATAKLVLKDLMQTSLPEGMPVALRIYGHRKAKACDTTLEMRLGPFKPQKGIRIIEKVDPKDRSRTPLAESLMLVADDLKTASGQRLVILLTDGEESCEGDPEDAIRTLRESGMDVRINIVGLAIDAEKTKKQFSHWARLGGGMYFEANDSKDLKSSLEQALFPKYQLIDNNGEVVIESVADGSPLQVPEGIYKLKVLTTPVRDMGEVKIKEGKTLKVEVKG